MTFSKFNAKLFYSLLVFIAIDVASISKSHADYLDLSASAAYQGLSIAMNYKDNKTYHVAWKPSSSSSWGATVEFDSSACYLAGSGTKCLYTTPALSCNITYEVKARWDWRGWRYASARTNPCPGTTPCPAGGTFDGANCSFGQAPSGTSAFIWGGNYYYTPLPPPNRCPYRPLSTSGFDLANCVVRPVPSGVVPFLWNNSWYYISYPW